MIEQLEDELEKECQIMRLFYTIKAAYMTLDITGTTGSYDLKQLQKEWEELVGKPAKKAETENQKIIKEKVESTKNEMEGHDDKFEGRLEVLVKKKEREVDFIRDRLLKHLGSYNRDKANNYGRRLCRVMKQRRSRDELVQQLSEKYSSETLDYVKNGVYLQQLLHETIGEGCKEPEEREVIGLKAGMAVGRAFLDDQLREVITSYKPKSQQIVVDLVAKLIEAREANRKLIKATVDTFKDENVHAVIDSCEGKDSNKVFNDLLRYGRDLPAPEGLKTAAAKYLTQN